MFFWKEGNCAEKLVSLSLKFFQCFFFSTWNKFYFFCTRQKNWNRQTKFNKLFDNGKQITNTIELCTEKDFHCTFNIFTTVNLLQNGEISAQFSSFENIFWRLKIRERAKHKTLKKENPIPKHKCDWSNVNG